MIPFLTRQIKIPFLLVLILYSANSFSCSLLKITKDGKTIVGNNEDFIFPNVKMSIEPGTDGEYGAIYFGNDDHNLHDTKHTQFNPQGGMNEAGLLFDYFSSSGVECENTENRPDIPNYIGFIKGLMKSCSNVYEVKDQIEKYNTCNWTSIAVFVDKSGNYLVADNGHVTIGSKADFVQTNLHSWQNSQCERFDTAQSLLKSSNERNIDFCAKVMNAMHQDYTMGGTQYTNVYDLDKGLIYLFYYHNFDEKVCLNIKEELQKGERIVYIPELFPNNKKGWENVTAFNHHRNTIIDLTDSLNLCNEHFFNGLKDSIKAISEDQRFQYHYFGGLKIMVRFLCLAGDYWWYKDNLDYAIKCYKLVNEYYPNSYIGYNHLGYSYFKQKSFALALDNFVIRHGLKPGSSDILSNIDSIVNYHISSPPKDLYHFEGMYGDDQYFLIIENQDSLLHLYYSTPKGNINATTGKVLSDKYLISEQNSIVFSNYDDSVYQNLKIYFAKNKGYHYRRSDLKIPDEKLQTWNGKYSDGKHEYSLTKDKKNNVQMLITKANGDSESIPIYATSERSFVHKYGRLNLIEDNDRNTQRLQISIEGKTVECKKIK